MSSDNSFRYFDIYTKGGYYMANSKKSNYINPYRRTRSYLQIVYPSSAPTNFIRCLESEVDKGVLRGFIVSPLHDLDKYDTNAENESLLRVQPLIQSAMEEIDQWAQQQVTPYYQQYCWLEQNLKETNPEVVKQNYAEYEKYRQSIFGQAQRQKYDARNKIIKEHTHKAGETKEPHYHIDVEYLSKKSQKQASEHLQAITNGTIAIAREKSLKAQVRYMAHLDEDPSKKAFYDPTKIYVYGNLKIEKFLEDEDRSMSSLYAWTTLKELVDDNLITNVVDFENLMTKQDLDLQLQVQKNVNLRTRVITYINAKREENNLHNIPSLKALERAVARKDIDYLVGHEPITLDYAEKKIKSIYAQIENEKPISS